MDSLDGIGIVSTGNGIEPSYIVESKDVNFKSVIAFVESSSRICDPYDLREWIEDYLEEDGILYNHNKRSHISAIDLKDEIEDIFEYLGL